MTRDSDSGSSRSPSAVEPVRSLKTTVTALRVPAGRARDGRGAPQARQNRARPGFGSPQPGQLTVRARSSWMPEPPPRAPDGWERA
jgi:hypothetical protein